MEKGTGKRNKRKRRRREYQRMTTAISELLSQSTVEELNGLAEKRKSRK